MKKIITAILVLIMLGYLGGCGDPEEGIPQPKPQAPTQQLDDDKGDQ